jgi:hypothetical protein
MASKSLPFYNTSTTSLNSYSEIQETDDQSVANSADAFGGYDTDSGSEYEVDFIRAERQLPGQVR